MWQATASCTTVALSEDGDIYVRRGTSYGDLQHPETEDHWKRAGNIWED
jgi:hypothetical protein